MNKKSAVIAVLLWLFIGACNVESRDQNNPTLAKKSRGIILQPYDGIDEKITEDMYQRLTKIFSTVEKQKSIPLPSSAFYKPRNRYKADTIIKIQQGEVREHFIMIGISHRDISTRKGQQEDWGVMGLAYRPGNSCIASYFRLPAKEKAYSFYKVVIHEIGHTEGLDHCENKRCFMQNAEGKNKTALLTRFCSSCKNTLLSKGWNL